MNDTSSTPLSVIAVPHSGAETLARPVSLAVAAGLLDLTHTALREVDDSDEDFAASERLLAALLDVARKV
jgi:hypothetical protein